MTRATSQSDFLDRSRMNWLLLVLGLVCAPQFMHTAIWISGSVILLGIWRYLATRYTWRSPPRWARLLLTIAAFLGALATYRGLNGIEAGSALLVLMLALKLMETSRRRDCLLLVFMAYFLVLAQFLYDPGILVVLYYIPVVWILSALFLDIAHPGASRPFPHLLRDSGRYLLPALPLMLILFILFPRIPGPLWGISDAAGSAVSGLGDSMTPGSISNLVLSDEVAFRVRFSGRPPAPGQRYWRGPVLGHFDGRTWEQYDDPARIAPPEPAGTVFRYSITLEPHERHWVYALDRPVTAPGDTVLLSDYQLVTPHRILERRRFDLQSSPEYASPREPALGLREQRRMLQLPAGFNPRARELARQWREAARQDGRAEADEIVAQALQLYRERFTYTLNPPLLGRHSVDEFLFETQRGFCEHYASSFVFLMRAAGIPARVVTGYLGAEPNPLSDYYLVRQSAAHAWAEVWLPDAGWTRIDPTAAVAPERVELGIGQALSRNEALRNGLLGTSELLNRMQMAWDTVNAGWNEFILGYGPKLQKSFLRFGGLENPSLRNLALLITGILVLAGGLMMFVLSRRNRPARLPSEVAAYARFCRTLAAAGIHRAPHEPPGDFALRARTAFPHHADRIRRITRLYEHIRYAGQAHAVNRARLQAEVREFVGLFKAGR